MSAPPQQPRAGAAEAEASTAPTATVVPSPSADATPPGLMWTRAGIVALVALVSWITISYCSNVYFDRDSAFHNALECTERVLGEHAESNWLLNGTLLGSTRLGRLVLWDADLDIGVLVPTSGDFDAASAALDKDCFGYRSIVKHGTHNPALRIWRKCTNRICAEFYETTLANGVAKTGAGESKQTDLFPLKPCTVSGVAAQCPNNAPFYLAQAYGQDWLTIPLIQLF
ncbi:LicD family [Novymonas esmeraldas]|uniref:LicD family n=1 Tax=Novymonas esmeraldas TaxID=1808958 RepID=A0AAW0EPF7_9TRYP